MNWFRIRVVVNANVNRLSIGQILSIGLASAIVVVSDNLSRNIHIKNDTDIIVKKGSLLFLVCLKHNDLSIDNIIETIFDRNKITIVQTDKLTHSQWDREINDGTAFSLPIPEPHISRIRLLCGMELIPDLELNQFPSSMRWIIDPLVEAVRKYFPGLPDKEELQITFNRISRDIKNKQHRNRAEMFTLPVSEHPVRRVITLENGILATVIDIDERSRIWNLASMLFQISSGPNIYILSPSSDNGVFQESLSRMYHSAQRRIVEQLFSTEISQNVIGFNDKNWIINISNRRKLTHDHFFSLFHEKARALYTGPSLTTINYLDWITIWDYALLCVGLRMLTASAVRKATKKSKRMHMLAIAHFNYLFTILYSKLGRWSSELTFDHFLSRNQTQIDEYHDELMLNTSANSLSICMSDLDLSSKSVNAFEVEEEDEIDKLFPQNDNLDNSSCEEDLHT